MATCCFEYSECAIDIDLPIAHRLLEALPNRDECGMVEDDLSPMLAPFGD